MDNHDNDFKFRRNYFSSTDTYNTNNTRHEFPEVTFYEQVMLQQGLRISKGFHTPLR